MPFLAVAAIVAGGMVATGVVAATTIAMIGIGVSVVGKVTKSKELSQIGAGMSLGAGVAGIAQSVFGGASTVAGTAEALAPVAGAENVAPVVDGVSSGAGTAEGAGGAMEAANTTPGMTGGLEGTGEVASSTGSSGGLLNPASDANLALSATPQSSVPLSSTPQASMAPGTQDAIGQAAANGSTGASVLPPPATDSGSIVSWFSKQPEAIKNRILQMGGQAVGGLFDGWSAEQKAAIERERLNLEKQKFNTQQSNANAQPKVAFQGYTPPTGGLLNPSKRG